MDIIAYSNDAGGVSIIYPSPDSGLTFEEIAEKDVPEGKVPLFLTVDQLPSFEWRNCWRLVGSELVIDEVAKAKESQIRALAAARQKLRADWESLPYDYIRGPYRSEFEAANKLLDVGDRNGAKNLIKYAEPKTTFLVEERANFEKVRRQFAEAIERLP